MKIKKLLSYLLTVGLAIILTMQMEVPIRAAEGPVSIVASSDVYCLGPGGTPKSYPNLTSAILSLGYGHSATIRCDSNNEVSYTLSINNKMITIDENGYKLCFDSLDISGNGSLTILGNLELLTNASGATVRDTAKLTVFGDVYASSVNTNAYGLVVKDQATVKINGFLNVEYGNAISCTGGTITVVGNVTAENNIGYPNATVTVRGGGIVDIKGDLRGYSGTLISISEDNSKLSCTNAVTSRGGIGITGGRVQINGNLTVGATNTVVDAITAASTNNGVVFIDGKVTGGSPFIVSFTSISMLPYPTNTTTVGMKVYYDYAGTNGWHVYLAKLPVAQDKKTEIVFVFPSVDGAQYYQIQRSLKKNKGFTTIGTSLPNYYQDYYLKAGTDYYYRARSAKKVGSKIVYGKWSKVTKITTEKLPVPTVGSDVKVKVNGTNIDFIWNKTNKMHALQVYYATSNTKKTKWKSVQASDAYLSVGHLAENKKYYYKVRYIYVNGSTSYSAFSPVQTINTKTDNNVVLSDFYVTKNITYTADPTVSYYEIYRSTNKTKGFSLVGTSKTAGFSDYYLLAGKTYYYKVRSVKIVGGKKQYSKYQPTQTVMTNPLPTISTEMVATSAVGAIDFQWTIVYDMSAIQVYYATTNDKKTKWKVVTVNTNKFSLRNLTANKLYYVKYRYVYNKGNVSYGPFSKPIEIKTN